MTEKQTHEQAYFISVGITYNKELAIKHSKDVLDLPVFKVVNIMATGDIVPLTVESITGIQSKVFAKLIEDKELDEETTSFLMNEHIVTISIMGILPAIVPALELDTDTDGQTMQ